MQERSAFGDLHTLATVRRVAAGRWGVDRATARTVGLCGVLVAVGATVRVALLISPVGRLNADEAVVGLMADRMRSAHHVPLFFWGQYYGGTIEPMIVAALFGVHRSVLTMRAVALGLSFAGAGVVVAIGRQLFGDRRAWLAGALVAAWPGTMYVSIREFGFYWAQFVLVVVAVAFALRLLATAPAWPTAATAAFGFASGLAWWQSPQAAFVLLPLGLWMLAFGHPPLRATLWAIGGALVGASPWLYALDRYGPRRLFTGPQHGVSYTRRLQLVFTQLIPRALGLRGSYRGGWLFSWVGIAIFVLAVAAVAVLAARLLRAPRSVMAPIVWCVVAFPFVVAVPSATSRVTDPRYAILLVPLVALLVARYARRPAAVLAVVVFMIAFSTANLVNVLNTASGDVHGLELRPMAVMPAARVLSVERIRFAYADYWIASPVMFDTRERIIVAPVDVVRSIDLQDMVDDHRSQTWLMYRSASRDRALPSELDRLHVGWTRRAVGNLAIYHLDRYIDPTTLMSFWKHHHAGAR